MTHRSTSSKQATLFSNNIVISRLLMFKQKETKLAKKGSRKLYILIVYSAYTVRGSLLDSLNSFSRHTEHKIFYVNLKLKNIPSYLLKIKFDLIIFHCLFFSNKFDREKQLILFEKASPLKQLNCRKVIAPQDEFINSDIVCDFVNNFSINEIFSVQPECVWSTIYGTLNAVKITPILTGYLDKKTVSYCKKFFHENHTRAIDIGYRCIAKPLAWFGKHGYLKQKIADVFQDKLLNTGISFDISTEEADAIHGWSWFDFLGSCEYVLGVEGGTSLYDRSGSIKKLVDEFTNKHPDAEFDEIEKNCFPGIDENFQGFAISPRHLEACMTGTCQILTEGSYSGILYPNIHYIPIKKDFSDIDSAIKKIKSRDNRNQIVKNAYRDIVDSGLYDISVYPHKIIGEPLNYNKHQRSLIALIYDNTAYNINTLNHKIDFIFSHMIFFYRKAKKHLRNSIAIY